VCSLLLLLTLLRNPQRGLHVIARSKVAPPLSEPRRLEIVDMLKQHHVEASLDFYNVLQQMVTLAPGLRLVYRTDFAGMYNDISQVVYFHNPKFARQPQLPLEEIPLSAINTLPLMTELFPDVQVFYDDDPVIPVLTGSSRRAAAAAGVPDSIDEFVRPQKQQRRSGSSSFAWLICCSSVFLLDTSRGLLWGSPDATLLPLVALILQAQPRAAAAADVPPPKRLDMTTAHGHVLFV
jgi:hypothetical protein